MRKIFSLCGRTTTRGVGEEPLWGGAAPLGRFTLPVTGAVLRVKSSRSRHALMPGEWSWPVTGVLVVLVKPGVTGS